MDRAATLHLGATELQLAPLTFAALEARADDIRRLAEGGFANGQELFDTTLRVVHASVQRRAPQVSIEQLKAELDWPAAHAAVTTVLQISFPQAPEGESRAASPSGALTGSS